MSEEAAAGSGGGLPGWVMTFADLMTLLMCFFVLMLSFSEMDVAKFKQLAGSMQEAFGVQAEIEVKTKSVGHQLLETGIDPARVMITGHADTQPRAANDSPANRALNRRIDITLVTNRDRHGTFAETGMGDASGDIDRVPPGLLERADADPPVNDDSPAATRAD